MYEGCRIVRQFQHGSRHVVGDGHLAVLDYLTDAVDRKRIHSGPRLNEVAAQAEGHRTSGRIHVQHTGSHLRGRTKRFQHAESD